MNASRASKRKNVARFVGRPSKHAEETSCVQLLLHVLSCIQVLAVGVLAYLGSAWSSGVLVQHMW